jgi:hypothetical protein
VYINDGKNTFDQFKDKCGLGVWKKCGKNQGVWILSECPVDVGGPI